MAASFFTGTDLELYNGTKNFSSLITASPTTYGLTASDATSYQATSDAYVSAWEAIQTPSIRTRTLTAEKNAAKILLKIAAADLAKRIDGTNTVTDAQKLELGLNVRKAPSPAGAPGTPTDFSAALRTDGALFLKWKCDNPPGVDRVIYQLYRAVDGGAQSYIGGAGKRTFIDATIPTGASSIIYTLQATRTTAVGVSADFLVKVGSDSTGAATVSVEQTAAPKAMKVA